ncbi:MAG TPA: PAS domain S-box protein [Rhodocyclaceae bacterium]|nr:PAS domain S-box protein [Rhodocyclaceae bacterium]
MESDTTIPRGQRSVLLVEDSLVEAEMLRRTLVAGGYRVTVAHDGRQALAIALVDPPDLVMSDIRMPVMNGYELCRAIKANPDLAHIPVILLSVLSEPDDIIEAVNAGADSYTIKPYTEASLLGRINSLLSRPTRAGVRSSEALEVEYGGKVHHIASEPQQMLNLLLSVYDNTLTQNRELRAIQAELSALNESLEGKVRERTAALQESEARFRATFEQAAVGIAHMAPDGHWLRVNQRLCDIVGYSQEEIQSLTFKDLTHPDDIADSLADMQKLVEGQADRYQNQKRYVVKHGDILWVNQTVALVRHADGTPDYFISVIEDISERKAAEAAVLQLNAELERRVEARTAELQAANTELESFTYAVSHDLRAPLRAMNGFSAILVDEHGRALDSEGRHLLAQIRSGAQHMGELIDGLLALARSTRGEMRRAPVDLSALAERILAELARTEPNRQVAWEVEPGLVAQGDGRMLEALMTNLLSNAWKYTARTPQARIRFHAEERDGQRLYCVADNGAGFDSGYAGRLFQPFQRLHRQDEYPGIGVGLATVKRIVERHGGTIEAEGKPGEGARFRFTLPEDSH